MAARTKCEIVSLDEVLAKGLAPDTNPPLPVVLVVDDERIIADTLALILEGAGIAASAAYDAKSALQSARIVPPNVLITDVDMPGMNGIDLAITLQKEIPDCKVLLFSGKSTTAPMLQRAREEGYDFSVLTKPIYPTDLLVELSKRGCGTRRPIDEVDGECVS